MKRVSANLLWQEGRVPLTCDHCGGGPVGIAVAIKREGNQAAPIAYLCGECFVATVLDSLADFALESILKAHLGGDSPEWRRHSAERATRATDAESQFRARIDTDGM